MLVHNFPRNYPLLAVYPMHNFIEQSFATGNDTAFLDNFLFKNPSLKIYPEHSSVELSFATGTYILLVYNFV